MELRYIRLRFALYSSRIEASNPNIAPLRKSSLSRTDWNAFGPAIGHAGRIDHRYIEFDGKMMQHLEF
jgi:hypothetical protein